jgi:hypothetical protein
MIIKLSEDNRDWYLEYSTVVDAPILYGMSLEEFKQYYQEEYGRSSMDELEKRLARVEEKGTSSMMHSSLEDTIDYNRAGKNETCLTKEQMIEHYCKTDHLKTEEDWKQHMANLPVGKRLGND